MKTRNGPGFPGRPAPSNSVAHVPSMRRLATYHGPIPVASAGARVRHANRRSAAGAARGHVIEHGVTRVLAIDERSADMVRCHPV
jgi:hypothetical protein